MTHGDKNIIISEILQRWYDENRRQLPWRETSDAYTIWISEIILQQTRVEQGMDYFLRFMRHFPDVESLAAVSEQEVMKLWQGLGYYSRARNLHAASKQIVSRFNGVFPSKHADIISLKGIGEYTAAAIASIAFNQPYAAIDGNVFRVVSRLFAVKQTITTAQGKRIISELASAILDKANPGHHNQAMMDFGAMICVPMAPKCGICVLRTHCLAFEKGIALQLPIKQKKKPAQHRYFNYFHIETGNKTYIQQRKKTDIWKNLYEFPLIETDNKVDLVKLQEKPDFAGLFRNTHSFIFHHKLSVKHVLSHQVIHADFYYVSCNSDAAIALKENSKIIEIEQEMLQDYPTSRLIQKYLEMVK